MPATLILPTYYTPVFKGVAIWLQHSIRPYNTTCFYIIYVRERRFRRSPFLNIGNGIWWAAAFRADGIVTNRKRPVFRSYIIYSAGRRRYFQCCLHLYTIGPVDDATRQQTMFIEISTFCADVVKEERGEMYKIKKKRESQCFGLYCVYCIRGYIVERERGVAYKYQRHLCRIDLLLRRERERETRPMDVCIYRNIRGTIMLGWCVH